MKFHFDNNGQYYVKQKTQRALKSTCKILLTLSLSYTIGTRFIPTSFTAITEETNPQAVTLQHIQSMDFQKQLDLIPSIDTMRAQLPENIKVLQGGDLLKALVKSVSGAFIEYPGIINQNGEVSASSIEAAREAIEIIIPGYIRNNNLRLSDDSFVTTNKENNHNGTRAYTKEQTVNYLINAGCLSAFNNIPSSVDALPNIPIDRAITMALLTKKYL